MEQCVARLDVAMFNAILRESDDEIPTDPVSDPIGDSKVLPIPTSELSFGAGAQLKNGVSNITALLYICVFCSYRELTYFQSIVQTIIRQLNFIFNPVKDFFSLFSFCIFSFVIGDILELRLSIFYITSLKI